MALVGEKIGGPLLGQGDYLFECGAVRSFAGREVEDERDASGITETMNVTGEPANVTGEPAPRTTESLFASPPFCAGSRDMTANRRRIQAVAGVVGHRLGKGRGDRFPEAALAPCSEALIDRHPLTVLLRQIAPRRPSADAPQDVIDDLPIVERGPALASSLRQSLNHAPTTL